MKKSKRLTHEQIRDAIRHFVIKGGNIDKLPDQKSSRSELVGSEKYETFETITSLLAN
jgi:hypothetical protein